MKLHHLQAIAVVFAALLACAVDAATAALEAVDDASSSEENRHTKSLVAPVGVGDADAGDISTKNNLRGLLGGLPEHPGAGCGNGATFCPQGFYCDTTTLGAIAGAYPKCLKCGDQGLPCCDGNTCTQGLACGARFRGRCGPCGVLDETCCADNYCEEDLVCSFDGTCKNCGRNGMRCCEGKTCSAQGLACINEPGTSEPTCQQCGAEGEPCCEGEMCNDGYGCGFYRTNGVRVFRNPTPQCIRLGDLASPCNPDGSCDFEGFVCDYDPTIPRRPALCVPCGGNNQTCCEGFACTGGQTCDLFNRADGEAPLCKDCGSLNALCCISEEPQSYCGNGLTCDWSGVSSGTAPFCNYAIMPQSTGSF